MNTLTVMSSRSRELQTLSAKLIRDRTRALPPVQSFKLELADRELQHMEPSTSEPRPPKPVLFYRR